MRRITATLPSPAMCVALLALFVALGGSAYAATKINAKQIRTGAVGARAVKNRALTSLEVRKDSLGGATIREERLKTVPSAASVPKNSIGASDLGNVTRRFGGPVTVANGQVTSAGVNCAKGEIVVGGGGRWADSAPGVGLQSSFASTDAAWTASGLNASGVPRRLQAFAMCLAP